MDIYSKYAVCVPMRNKFALATANAMRRIIQRLHLDIFGSVIHADNGTAFKGEFGDLMDEFGLKLIHGKSYTSVHNRAIERFQQTLRRAIGKWVSSSGRSDWQPNLRTSSLLTTVLDIAR
jgi:hypothetical protein